MASQDGSLEIRKIIKQAWKDFRYSSDFSPGKPVIYVPAPREKLRPVPMSAVPEPPKPIDRIEFRFSSWKVYRNVRCFSVVGKYKGIEHEVAFGRL